MPLMTAEEFKATMEKANDNLGQSACGPRVVWGLRRDYCRRSDTCHCGKRGGDRRALKRAAPPVLTRQPVHSASRPTCNALFTLTMNLSCG